MKYSNTILVFLGLFIELAIKSVGLAQTGAVVNYQGRIAVRGVNFDGIGRFKFAFVDGVTVATPDARTATATATVESGGLSGLAIVDGGAGYAEPPLVTLEGGAGSGASARAIVISGAVTGLEIVSAGTGYTSEPSVAMAAPPPAVSTTSHITYWSNDGSSVAGSEPTQSIPLTVTKGLYATPLGDTSIPTMATLSPAIFQNANVNLRVWFNDEVHGWQQLSPDQKYNAPPFSQSAGEAEMATSVKVKQYELVPFNYFDYWSGFCILPQSVSNKDSKITLTRMLDKQITKVRELRAPVELSAGERTMGWDGRIEYVLSGGLASLRLISFNEQGVREVMAESTKSRENGLLLIRGNFVLDWSKYQYAVEIYLGSLNNRGDYSMFSGVNECQISYDSVLEH